MLASYSLREVGMNVCGIVGALLGVWLGSVSAFFIFNTLTESNHEINRT